MTSKQTQTFTKTYSLSDRDMHSRHLASSLPVQSSIQAGIEKCNSSTEAAAQACCDGYAHAGSVYQGRHGYACQVDDGTGDWD